jgi:N-acetylmuramoyl-L-alanine amidase
MMLATATSMLALVVVLDPGHGGSNTGAPARVAGVSEKQITMAVARQAKRQLEAAGAVVVLTRDRDEYLTLRERVRRANAAGPTCFVSIHANASPEHGRRGVETYVLSREPVEVEARRARIASGDPTGVAGLLAELALVEGHRASLGLARAVHAAVVEERAAVDARGERVGDRGVRQASYDVLAGVAAPAILVEIGFLDHPVEGAELLRPDTQRRIGEAIAAAILGWASHPSPLARR